MFFPLFSLVLTSVTVAFFTLTRGELWLDDFAGYLMQAKSILSWSMPDFLLHNSFTVQTSSYPPGPAAYPWGFPLLLAPVYASFGLSPLPLKLVNLIFFAGFLVCLFLLARTRLRQGDALLITGLLAFAPAMIAANDLILSDIPFLAFSTLSLFLIESLHLEKKIISIAAGASIFAAFFIRTNGMVLLAPLLISLLLVDWPNWLLAIKKASLPVLTFAVLLGLQTAMFPGGQSSYLSHFSLFSLPHLLDNFIYYLWLPSRVFDGIPAGVVLYPVLLFFLCFSIFTNWRRDAVLYVYAVLTTLVFIIWPERQGLRFIYPVLPILFVTAVDGMRQAVGFLNSRWQVRANLSVHVLLGAILLTALLISTYSAYKVTSGGRTINGPFDSYSQEMFAYVRENTAPESVIVFMRPRALRLFTERDAFMTVRCDDLFKGDYVVLHLKMEGNGQIPPEKILSCKAVQPLADVFHNKRFIVYKLNR
ncbi:MAG: hypothetical protein WCK35_09705 [Chloroflexota bacterium]